MLSEFDQIEATFGTEKAADLRKACRYLLRNQFAYSGDRGAATVYNTLRCQIPPGCRRSIRQPRVPGPQEC